MTARMAPAVVPIPGVNQPGESWNHEITNEICAYCALTPVPDRIREGPEGHQRQCMERKHCLVFSILCFRAMIPVCLSSNPFLHSRGSTPLQRPPARTVTRRDRKKLKARRSSRAPGHQGTRAGAPGLVHPFCMEIATQGLGIASGVGELEERVGAGWSGLPGAWRLAADTF